MSALDIEKELDNLTRYDHRGALMEPDQAGDYLLVSEVRDLLAAHVSGQGGEDARELATLREVRAALHEANDKPNGPICDTIWMPDRAETLFDFIDAAIAATQSKEAVNG